jgi:hypothetical protein
MTKRVTRRFAFAEATIDAIRMSGGGMNRWDEAGQRWITYAPVAPEIGQPIETTVIVRCGACGHPVGQVDEWDHADEGHVECFIGRTARRGIDGESIVPGTSYALLHPSHGTEPRAMCPKHGPVLLTAAELRNYQADARYRQRQAAAGSPNGKVTRRVRAKPVDPGWTQDQL